MSKEKKIEDSASGNSKTLLAAEEVNELRNLTLMSYWPIGHYASEAQLLSKERSRIKAHIHEQ
jgi:hypothetical protein